MQSPESTAPQLAAKIIEDWVRGQTPDAKKALADHPEWAGEKSLVLDLAYAEYFLRTRAGEEIDVVAYCAQYPAYRISLERLLAQHALRDERDLATDLPEKPVPASVDPLATSPVVPEGMGVNTQNIDVMPLHEAPAVPTPGTTPSPSGALSAKLGPKEWPESGVKIGDYDLKRQMGKGAFGRVFLAFEETTERFVVVKLSKNRCDEAKVLGKLVHKNVVSVLSAPHDQATGLYIIAMPYHGSATFEDLIELAYPLAPTESTPRRAEIILTAARRNHHQNDPTPDEFRPDQFLNRASFIDGIVWLGVRLAEALGAVHSQGFVHHDLKPSNVLLGLDGQPRLLDFNLATDVKNTKSRLGGTLPYMPPEHLQALEQANLETLATPTMNAQGDIFSYGVIMYELLTGIHPFGRVPKQRSVRRVAGEMLGRQKLGVKPIRERNPEVPQRLAKLVERCLAFDIALRPATAAEIATEMRRCYSLKKRALAFAGSGAGRSLVMVASIGSVSGAFLYASTFASTPAPVVIDHRKEGQAALESKRYAEATNHLRLAAQLTPTDAEVWYALGRAHLAQGELGAARRDFEKASDLRPTHGPTLALFGWTLVKTGQVFEAIEVLNKATRHGYDNAAIHNLKAFCYAQRRFDIEASTEAELALQADPNYRPALVNRVYVVYLKNGMSRTMPDRFYADVERILAVGKPDPDVLLWAARLYTNAATPFGNPKAPLNATQAKHKERALALLRQACEAGASDSLWMTDSLFVNLFGNAKVYARDWVRQTRPVEASADWRMGDPLTDFPG